MSAHAALIGSTGFVGGNLARQFTFDDRYHSRNIAEISGKSYELLVCCGLPAAKWIANREPEVDRANMEGLANHIRSVTARQAILISTIDVYPVPKDVDESSPIGIDGHHAYGSNRFLFERAFRVQFPHALILRLPALFGEGLKKNAIFDFLNDNNVEKIHCDAIFQWYDLKRLWTDIQRFLAAELELVNVATEPVSIGEITREAFGFTFENRPFPNPPSYDFKSLYAERFGGTGGYFVDRVTVLAELKAYVDKCREVAQ